MTAKPEGRGRLRNAGRQDVCAPSTAWRVFCAIEVPQEVRARLTAHIETLRRRFPAVRASWTRDDKFHLTLKFLGEIPQERVENLSIAVTRAASSVAPFKLMIEGAGAFPQNGPPKVLWLGVTDVERGLTVLHTSLEAECVQEGFAKETRPFRSHLTIARIRESYGARALASFHRESGFPAVEFFVSELLVIRSELSSAGSKYTVVSRHDFTGCGDAITGSAGVPPA